MRQSPSRRASYLNVILTVNAVFLGGLLWTQVAGSPLGSTATAAPPTPPVPGLPNASAQRLEMIELLRSLNANVDATNKAMGSGSLRVTVTNLSEINTGDGG